MTNGRPADWKNYEDFAAGIATNRLPPSTALAGTTQRLRWPDHQMTLHFITPDEVEWSRTGSAPGVGRDWCEVIAVAPGTYFIDMTFAQHPTEALTLIFNQRSRRALAIRSRIRDAAEAGAEPRVAQQFLVGHLDDGSGPPSSLEPHATRELIGLRTWQTYSPEHTYEHTYLSAERYAWQCLIGVQRGHGDVDMASYFKFEHEQYVFTFREFLIPVASVFFFNFADGRSTGKFLGLTAAGAVANNPAGAFMRKASMTFYPPEFGPV